MEVLDGQMDLDSFLKNEEQTEKLDEYYKKAVQYVNEKGVVHAGTLMRLFRISANSSLKLMEKLKENGIIGDSGRLLSEKKNEWTAKG